MGNLRLVNIESFGIIQAGINNIVMIEMVRCNMRMDTFLLRCWNFATTSLLIVLNRFFDSGRHFFLTICFFSWQRNEGLGISWHAYYPIRRRRTYILPCSSSTIWWWQDEQEPYQTIRCSYLTQERVCLPRTHTDCLRRKQAHNLHCLWRRHKNVRTCAIGALILYIFQRWEKGEYMCNTFDGY